MGIFSLLKGERVLYYPGCLTKGVLKDNLENYKEIFNKLGIDFVMLPDDEVCCGLPILNAGYRKESKKLAEKNLKLFKERGITKIITNCPSCFSVFNKVYPKILKDWNIPVEHATVAILKGLRKKGIRFSGEKVLVSYHDPCHLGRYSGIYDEPRKVIELLGGEILEADLNKENAVCCGGGGGIRANFEKTAKMIAKKRVEDFDDNVGKIISPCGLCYANLKTASEKSVEFSDFVVKRLRGLL